ncbi:MAG TPA: amidohydrolase family protein [Sphingomicrobium sp.]|nr:amidohydrolase family protein [Sphingomicrobium sp.]
MCGSRWRSVAALLAILVPAGSSSSAQPTPARLPVIDMHVHAGRLNRTAPVPVCPGNRPLTFPALDPKVPPSPTALLGCDRPIYSATTGLALRDGTIAELRRHNVRRAVLAGNAEVVAEWSAVAPGLFIPAASPPTRGSEALARLRRLHGEGRAAVFAELGAQYVGLRADDPSLEPFWALAEELDVPVGIHLGEGNPGQQGGTTDRYRVGLTSPFQLEEVLIKHPRLRIWVMHAASPLTDEMIAMLFEYPSLYIDLAANVWNMPRAQLYDQLKRFVDAGFSKRILHGSDQTIWPQSIGLAIETVEQAPFLTPEQKRDILYNNAARFLRLTPAEIARDHEQ